MMRKKRILIIVSLGLIICSLFLLNNPFWANLVGKNTKITENEKIKIKSAKYWPNLARIHINDINPALDWATTALNNDWCNGSGTWGDPYIIKNVIIDGQERESCILIENSDVFFVIENCSVYNSGDEFAYNEEAGIKLLNTSNGFLTNNNCSFNNIFGIYLRENSNNNTISANFINRNGAHGIFFEDYCYNNTIIGNEINNNFQFGIQLKIDCGFNNVSRNVVNDNINGIHLFLGINNTISENIISDNSDYGILIFDQINDTITNNKMTKCGIGIEGSFMDLPSNIIDTSNEVNGKSFYLYFNQTDLSNNNFTSSGQPGQIILISCNDSVISDNFNLSQTSTGISLFNCKNITISKIHANECNFYGIELRNSNNNSITGNYAKENNYGIFVSSGEDIIINRNNATNNIWGIGLDSCFSILIKSNNLSKNDESGIDLESSTENNITDNQISQNKREGLKLMGSSFNIISNNSINENINTITTSYGIGIILEEMSNNNTIIGNIISNNSYAGIILSGRNNSISENNFTNCGLHFSSYSIEFDDLISHNIDSTNLVNKKPLYFYSNKVQLDYNNFSNPGQIILVNCNKSSISNIDLSYSTAGISLYFCNNATITKNNLTHNFNSGLLLVESSYIDISDNNLNNNINTFLDTAVSFGFAFGLYLEDCFKINITNNNMSNNGAGICVFDSSDNLIKGNTLNDNSIGGIIILYQYLGSCDNNNMTENTMVNCSFFIYPSPNPSPIEPILYIDESNSVNNKPVYYYYHKNNLNSLDFLNAGQVILSGCTDSVISDLDFTRSTVGVTVLYSDNITITKVNSSNNSNYGILVSSSVDCTIIDNIASGNIMGILNFYSNNILIANNTANNNKQLTIEAVTEGLGIASAGYNNTITENIMKNNPTGLLASGKFNNVSKNVIENCIDYGILANGFQNSSITRNNIIDNEIGISLPENQYNDNNSIFYNNFIGNGLNAEDKGSNNKWDDEHAGNYWADYTGIDANIDGIGDNSYPIKGPLYNKDYFPLMYRTDVDTDGDGFINYEEYALGRDNYRTNVSNPDSDYDELNDFWEWKNSTNPLKWDTDNDKMPDGWEVFNFLNPLNRHDNVTDPDTDFLLNIYEYLNGTNPNNADTDGDNFLDGIELGVPEEYNFWTDPLNKWWYPMPNLAVVAFKATSTAIGKPFVLNITITNNGIWNVENITVIIWVEFLGRALYNSTIDSDDPINLDVNEVFQDLIQSAELYQGGTLVMELQLDPENLINETYSEKDGSYRYRGGENDNTLETTLQIVEDGEVSPGNGGIDPLIIILIVIGAAAFAGIVSTYTIVRPRIKRRAIFKKQIENAKRDMDNFEFNIRSLIKTKLTDTYESAWWDKGIPEYIRRTIGTKLKMEKPKKLAIQVDEMNLLDFTHYSSIITFQENWEKIFSKTFPNKNEIETNFENLRLIKRDLNEGTITHEQLSSYPFYIHAIRNYFTKGFNVFLSYSTQDTEYYNIKEIAKRLEAYPEIDRVFFWEEDSGENIVTYMERTLKMTKAFVFFCTERSIRSKAVEDEWQAAFQMRKKGLLKIVPVYEKEDLIPFLLTPLLNVKFTKDDFDEFIQKLHDEIVR